MPRLYQSPPPRRFESLPARTKPAAASLAPRIIWKIAGGVPVGSGLGASGASAVAEVSTDSALTGNAVAERGEATATTGAAAAAFRVRFFSHAAAVFPGLWLAAAV